MSHETPSWILDFKKTIDQATPVLMSISVAKQIRKPALDKWSPKEIIGHLIDSANNNHRRFVRAQWQSDLTLLGYEQVEWVENQNYQEAEWKPLITLWQTYNLHLVHVMKMTSPDQMKHIVRGLNLGYIKPKIPATDPATLEQLMKDYIAHLKHHLTQILQLTQ